MGVFAELPDEVEDRWIGAAFRGQWPDASSSEHHGYVQKVCDERVGCVLQGCAFDVPKPL